MFQEITQKLHSIVEMTSIDCNDDNPKIIQIKFDTGSLKKNDIWNICSICNQKPEFAYYRIYEKNIGKSS
jgi:hypothetical protein